MFVHLSTPSYPKPVILQILLHFCEHVVSLIRHLCNLGTAFIPSVCSTFMIQQIAQKRKPSWVMLCNFEYLERGDIFHSVSCSSLQVFPCCHGKGFMKQIQPKRSRFSMAPEISAQPPSPTQAQQRKTKCSHQRKTEGRKRIKIKNGKDSYKNKSSNSTPRLYSRELKTYVHTRTWRGMFIASCIIT